MRALSDRLDKRIDEQDSKMERLSERLGRAGAGTGADEWGAGDAA